MVTENGVSVASVQNEIWDFDFHFSGKAGGREVSTSVMLAANAG